MICSVLSLFLVALDTLEGAHLLRYRSLRYKMTPDSNLVTAAISALVGCPVLTHDEYANNPGSDIQALDPEDFHNSVLVGPVERLDLILPPRQRQVLPHPLHAVREDSLVEVSDKVSCERSRPSRQATEIVKEKSRAAHDQGFNFWCVCLLLTYVCNFSV